MNEASNKEAWLIARAAQADGGLASALIGTLNSCGT